MKTGMRWLKTFFITIIVCLLVWAGLVIYIDPFFHYHGPLESFPYIVDDQVDMNPGLARHLDYDSVILGSSMVVNFNTDVFEEKLGLKTAKLPYNGAYPKDQSNILSIIFDAKKDTVKQVFIGVDELNYSGGIDETKFPITDYLYDENPFNDVKYLFNKDVMLDYCIKPMFDRSDSTAWNMIYPFWWQDEHYQKALVLMYYEEAQPLENSASCEEYIEAIKLNLDTNILPYIEAHPETKFTVFYPPYSILYWNDVCNKDELDTVMEKYRYMSGRFLEYDNVELFFFQNREEIICDLNNYADYTHYSPKVCEYMVQCFADNECRVDESNLDSEIDKLYELTSDYDYDAIWDDWYN
jgi:hypothetical protein